MAKNELEIVASLNVNATEVEIQKGLDKISTDLQAKQIPKFVAQLDVTKTKEIVQAQLNSLGNLKVGIGINATNSLPNLNIAESVSQATSSLSVLEQKWKEQGILTGDFKAKVEQLKASLTSVGNVEGLNKYKTDLAILTNEVKGFNTQMGNGSGTAKQAENIERLRTKLQKLIYDINAYKNANSKAMNSNIVSANGNTIAQNLNSMETQARQAIGNLLDPTKLSQVNTQAKALVASFGSIKSEVKSLDKAGNTLFTTALEKAKKFAGWMGMTFVVSSLTRGIRGLFADVADLNTELVDLRKTTNATDEQLNEFYYAANDTAKQLGTTTKEVISAASSWSRLGYSIKEAKELAETSSILASISPEMDMETAQTSLVSILKAYGIEAEDALDGVASKINIIGNTQAVSNEDIADFLTRSSSAMAEANNSLEQTIALGTAATEITQDADSVGTALKTLSMRLRGYDEQTESYTEDVENLSGKIADLTKTASTPGGISLFTDKDKTTYKSTYQLLQEISTIYDELTDKTQAKLLEAIAGRVYLYVQKCA